MAQVSHTSSSATPIGRTGTGTMPCGIVTSNVTPIAAYAIRSGGWRQAAVGGSAELGSVFLVNRLAFRFDAPQPGEVVVFDRPADAPVADDRLVKRIVAMSG